MAMTTMYPGGSRITPVKGCLKIEDRGSDDLKPVNKKVFFDEIMIKEYPIILGDHPAVSSGAPVTIGWKPSNESVIDLDFYEYCRIPERRPRKKLIISVRRRANTLLTGGYSIDQIANATIEVERIKKLRADSLRSAGFSNPWEMLSGAVETTGMALKRVDVLGVGTAAGVMVGAGAALGMAAGNAAVQGVNTVVNVGTDVTVSTGRMLVTGVQQSSRGVVGAGKAVAKPVVGVGKTLVVKPVGIVVTTTGKVVVGGGKAIGNGITTTGRAMGTVVTSTGRAIANMVNPSVAIDPTRNPKGSPKGGIKSPKEDENKKITRTASYGGKANKSAKHERGIGRSTSDHQSATIDVQ